MIRNEQIFIKLADYVKTIAESDEDWEAKYDKIFNDDVSSRMYKLVHFHPYDPDASYQEDVEAFVHQAQEKANELRANVD